MTLVLSIISFAVILILFLAVIIRLYITPGMSDLLSALPNHKVGMLRLQFLFVTVIAAPFYLLLVISSGEFPPVPNEVVGLLSISSLGYLSGKGLGVYREWENIVK